MKLTKREEELCKVQDQGKRDFDNNFKFNDDLYKDDVGKRAAYKAGWQEARADYNSFDSNYY